MQILAQQPGSIAKILDASFKLFAASFSKLFGFSLLLAAMYILLTILTSDLGVTPEGSPEAMETALYDAVPKIFAYTAVITLLSFIIYAAMLYRIDNVVQQREDSFSEALLFGLKKFPAMFLALFLYSLAVMVGSLLLVVPGIILMLSLSFYPLFIVIEDLGSYAALKASHNLVWGNWWRTLTVYMAPGIIMLVVFFTFGFIAAALGSSEPGSINPIELLTDLISALVMPYFYALAYVLYHDLKLRKSGGDLAARLAY